MNEAKYPSKQRVERDGALVYAEGDDLLADPDEAKRQGYKLDAAAPVIATSRVERDGVLVYAEGDVIPADDEAAAGQAKKQAKADEAGADKAERPAANKARKPTAKK